MYSVSVIMPVYNNEKTLKRAIESILNQTVYDLELILINDGSTDASAQICDEYAKKEPLLVEAIHQKRSGLGPARNKGLFKASGKYVYFANPSDTFDPKMLEKNIHLGVDKAADLVVFGFTEENEKYRDGKLEHLPRIPDLSKQVYFRDHYRNFHHFYPYVLHNKLYRREYLRKNRIQFHKIPLKEAAFFNLSVYKNLEKVAFNRHSYLNWDNNEHASTTTYQPKLYEVYFELAKFFEAVINYWEYEETFPDLIAEEYYNVVYAELKNLSTKENGLNAKQQEERIQTILEDEKVKNALKDLKFSKGKTPYMKAVLGALKNNNCKAALQLVSHKNGTEKTTTKVVQFIRKWFVKK